MNKEIVFVNQVSGYLMIDIIIEFGSAFQNRTLITGSINSRSDILGSDVKVHRISRYNRRNTFFRITSWVFAFFQISFLLLFKYRKAHVFFVTNPPLVIFIPLFIFNKFSLLVYDIYPDTLFKHNFINKNSYLGRFWTRVNKRVFSRAENIFTISNGMRDAILKYGETLDVTVIPVWADTKYFKPIPKENNQFIKDLGLLDKFIVLYSGNLGITHDVEVLVEVASIMNRDDIHFLIIGNGAKEQVIRDRISELGLKNCQWLPLQPVELLPYTIGGADIGVVSAGRDSDNLSIPSKAFSLFAAGKTLICIADEGAELSRIVRKFNLGEPFSYKNIEGIRDFICKVADNDELKKNYSENALKASLEFDKSNLKKFTEKFNSG